MKDTAALVSLIGDCWGEGDRPDPEVIGRLVRALISSGLVRMDEDEVVQAARQATKVLTKERDAADTARDLLSAQCDKLTRERDHLSGEVVRLERLFSLAKAERDTARKARYEPSARLAEERDAARADCSRLARDLCQAQLQISDLEDQVAVLRSADSETPDEDDADEDAYGWSVIETVVIGRMMRKKLQGLR
jgi:chromosome segregation ATPase